MNTDELSYCLAKQLARAHTVQSEYGDFALDDELSEAVASALRPIIERRIKNERMSKKKSAPARCGRDW